MQDIYTVLAEIVITCDWCVMRRTQDLPVRRILPHPVDDGKTELSLCQIFAKAFIIRILRLISSRSVLTVLVVEGAKLTSVD